jgi:hypothetical protein
VVRALWQLLNVLLVCLHLLCGHILLLLLLLLLLEPHYWKFLLRTYMMYMRIISIMNVGSGEGAMTWCGAWVNMFTFNY